MAATVTLDEAPRATRLDHIPALDGLRGAAVLAVLAYHGGLGWARGGFLGVSLFLTLSGFLITSLLMAEHSATGTLGLRSFWSRRARRLLPAALLGLVLAVVATMLAVPPVGRAAAMVDIRHAALHLANWRFIWVEAPYAGLDAVPSPVLHYWSLAIEEQFYLLFPPVALLALRRSRRALCIVLLAVVTVSLWRQGTLSGDRAYFGTDTRAAELGLGGLLAVGWRAFVARGWRERSVRLCDAAGIVGVTATVVLWVGARQADPALLSGGLTAVACLSCLVLLGAVGGRWVPAALAWRPLRTVGLVSYGLYVVHWPVFLVLSPERTGIDGAALLGARMVVAGVLATASYVAVERPVRAGRRIAPRLLAGGAVALVVAVAATVPVARGLADAARDGVASGTIRPTGMSPTTSTWAVVGPAVVQSGLPRSAGTEGAGGVVDDPAAASDAPRPPAIEVRRPPRLVVVGDSTAAGIGAGLLSWAERTGGLQLSVVAGPGCPVLLGEVARYREGYEFVATGCESLFSVAATEAVTAEADAIVVFMGSAQLADWRYAGDPDWRSILEAPVADQLRTAFDRAVSRLASSGLPVLWADLPTPAWDLEAFGRLLGGATFPGSGAPVTNDPARAEVFNGALGEVVAAWPGVVAVPFAAGLAGEDGTIEPADRADGLHLSEQQVVDAADSWLVAELARAHLLALAELASYLPPDLSWTPGA